MKNLELLYESYKEYKVDSHATLESNFEIVNRTFIPYQDLPFEMFDSDMTFTKYYQYMSMKREDTVESMVKTLTKVSEILGEIKLEDIVFRKIDNKLKKKNSLIDNTVKNMKLILNRIKS